ncbi:MAG: hypothetical protein J5629_06805 [Muribaculaceae bacterium]|nr:hypothetical protein [Muribaculaceae bacterium]
MKNTLFLFLAFVALMLSSCSVNFQGVTANYVRMNNYYVSNQMKNGTHKLVIHNQQEFESVFGSAAVMGRNGQPTNIDFRHQFVIAVILPETDRQTTIETVMLKRLGDRLYYSYIIEEGHRTSYTMRPFTAVIVDRNEPSDVVFQRVTRQDLENAGIQYNGPSTVRPPL